MVSNKWTIGLLLVGLSTGAFADSSKTLNVALDGTFAPMAMPKMGGGVEGFNVDLANAIGAQLKQNIHITSAQFSGLISAMQAGTYDFLVAPVTINKERAKNMLFSEGYLNTDYQFLVKKGTPKITGLSGFENKVVAVNKGSNYDKWARDNAAKYHWKVASYGTNSDAIQAVVSGRAFAALSGNTTAAWAAKRSPMVDLSYVYSTGAVWGFPFRPDDHAMRDKVDAAIECLKVNGTISKLSQKWFGVTPKPGSAAVTPQSGYGEPGFAGYDATEHAHTCG